MSTFELDRQASDRLSVRQIKPGIYVLKPAKASPGPGEYALQNPAEYIHYLYDFGITAGR
jgi:hypothetical protein